MFCQARADLNSWKRTDRTRFCCPLWMIFYPVALFFRLPLSFLPPEAQKAYARHCEQNGKPESHQKVRRRSDLSTSGRGSGGIVRTFPS